MIYGLWQVGLQLRGFGPAKAWEIFLWPGLLAAAALALGGVLGLSAIRRRDRSLSIFERGFVLRERGRATAWQWEEVVAITSHVTRNYLLGIHAGTRHRYTLRRVDGSEMILDDSIRRVEQAVRFIQQETFQGRFGQVVREIESGESVAFGPIQLEDDGFRVGGRACPWSEFQGVEMRNGRLYISSKTKLALPVEEIPNPDVLVTILLQNVQS